MDSIQMEKKNRIIHIVTEIVLAIICMNIGRLEDAHIGTAFAVTTVYNVVHVIFLRKRTGEKLAESIWHVTMVWAYLISLSAIYIVIKSFFCGVTVNGLFGNGPGKTYYGVEAWKNSFDVFIMVPLGFINVLYIIGTSVLRYRIFQQPHHTE